MSSAATVPHAPAQAGRHFAPLPAILSYLVPGLGQIYQGRVAKGVLFLVCIYTLFIYGMYLGSGTETVRGTTYRIIGNVYLPDTSDRPNSNPFGLPRTLANIYNRPQFAGQFWVGVAAWPAVWQYLNFDPEDPVGPSPFYRFERTPSDEALNAINVGGDHMLDLGWVYTVIAGVLNIMVIYDALAGPAFLPGPHAHPVEGFRLYWRLAAGAAVGAAALGLIAFRVASAAPQNMYLDLPVLIVFVSLVYSATRFDQWGPILGEALRWGLRLAGFLAAIAVVLYLALLL
jgi:hypothetical protein